MRFKYNNIVILAVVGVLVVMAIKPRSPLGIFLRSMTHIGPEYPDIERMLGLIAWVLMTVLFIVTIRALLNRKNH